MMQRSLIALCMTHGPGSWPDFATRLKCSSKYSNQHRQMSTNLMVHVLVLIPMMLPWVLPIKVLGVAVFDMQICMTYFSICSQYSIVRSVHTIRIFCVLLSVLNLIFVASKTTCTFSLSINIDHLIPPTQLTQYHRILRMPIPK